MNDKDLKKRLEQELLSNPESAQLVIEQKNKERHQQMADLHGSHFKDVFKALENLSDVLGKIPEDINSKQAKELGSIGEKIGESIGILQKISGNTDERTHKELIKMNMLLEKLARKETVVNVKPADVNVPEPVVKSTVVKETKEQKAMVKLLESMLKQLKTKQSPVRISNSTPDEAIPVVLTDRMKEGFYNVVTAISQSANNTAKSASALVTEAFDYIDLTHNGSDQLTQAVYKQGGAAGTTVATLDITYDGSGNIDTVTKT